MMKKAQALSDREVWAAFREWVSALPSKKAAAAKLGISETYLGDIFHGRRALTEEIAMRSVGYTHVWLKV